MPRQPCGVTTAALAAVWRLSGHNGPWRPLHSARASSSTLSTRPRHLGGLWARSKRVASSAQTSSSSFTPAALPRSSPTRRSTGTPTDSSAKGAHADHRHFGGIEELAVYLLADI